MEVQYIRQHDHVYNSNKLDNQCLVWPPLYFNTALTFIQLFSLCNFFKIKSSLCPGLLKDAIQSLCLDIGCLFVQLSVKMVPHCFNNVEVMIKQSRNQAFKITNVLTKFSIPLAEMHPPTMTAFTVFYTWMWTLTLLFLHLTFLSLLCVFSLLKNDTFPLRSFWWLLLLQLLSSLVQLPQFF